MATVAATCLLLLCFLSQVSGDIVSDRIRQLEQTVLDLQNKEQNHVTQMQTVLSKLSSTADELASVKKELTTIKDKSKILVAFQVKKNSSDDKVPASKNYVVKFDNVIQNQGNGYDVTTGVFTAPVSGLYRFWAKVDPVSRRTSPLSLIRNGARIISSTDYDYNFYTAVSKSLTYYMLVNKGDRIWVQLDESIAIDRRSYLEGVLMHG